MWKNKGFAIFVGLIIGIIFLLTIIGDAQSVSGNSDDGDSVDAIDNGSGVSDSYIHYVESAEGYSPVIYVGVDGLQTIGYGHTVEKGESFVYLPQPDAEALLKNDLKSSIVSVHKEFGGVQLSQNQTDALVDVAYNLGNNFWRKAPKLVADIKSGADPNTLEGDFEKFSYSGKQQVLLKRRNEEWKIYCYSIYSSD